MLRIGTLLNVVNPVTGIFTQVGLIAFVNGQVCLLQDTSEST